MCAQTPRAHKHTHTRHVYEQAHTLFFVISVVLYVGSTHALMLQWRLLLIVYCIATYVYSIGTYSTFSGMH